MSVWSSLHTLHTTYVLCIAISFLNSNLIFMQLCVVCIAMCYLFNNLLYMQPSFLHSPLFFMWPCVLCIVIHSSHVELWSSHITCTHHLLSSLHMFHFGMSIFVSFVGMFFLFYLLDFVFFFNSMNFFNLWFFNCFLFWLFIVLLSSVCNCLELAMDTKELLVTLGMIVLLIETLQHVSKEDNSSSRIFLSTFSNEKKILIFFLWLLFCIFYD